MSEPGNPEALVQMSRLTDGIKIWAQLWVYATLCCALGLLVLGLVLAMKLGGSYAAFDTSTNKGSG